MSGMSAVDALREACGSTPGGLAASSASLSPDGATLTLSGVGHDARSAVTVTDAGGGGRTASYSLASVYLLLTNPNVLTYRKACEAAGVSDPVKVLDKGLVNGYFRGAGGDGKAGGGDAPGEGTGKPAAPSSGVQFTAPSSSSKRSRSGGGKDRKHRSSSSSRGKPSSSSSAPPRKKAKAQPAPITNEMLVSNLSLIVDKRDASSASAAPPIGDEGRGAGDAAADGARGDGDGPGEDGPAAEDREDKKEEKEDRELLLSWLSPAGFEVASLAAEVEADRDAVRRITSLEIPVGDSSSILRAGAGGEVAGGDGGARRRDFARVLSIYQDVERAEHRARHASSSSKSGGGKAKRPPPPSSSRGKGGAAPPSRSPSSSAPASGSRLPPGNPIIIVPNAMTSVVTMVNAPFFLGEDARYVPREVALKDPRAGRRGGTFSVTRRMASRLGGHELTYDVIDNPATRLRRPEDWRRVVAVVCQGQSWQFKGWRLSDPVELFTSAFGFYVGLDGAAVPAELRGWNVKTSRISRDRRGMDNVCMASFWNGVEEFVSVHKQGFIRP